MIACVWDINSNDCKTRGFLIRTRTHVTPCYVTWFSWSGNPFYRYFTTLQLHTRNRFLPSAHPATIHRKSVRTVVSSSKTQVAGSDLIPRIHSVHRRANASASDCAIHRTQALRRKLIKPLGSGRRFPARERGFFARRQERELNVFWKKARKSHRVPVYSSFSS